MPGLLKKIVKGLLIGGGSILSLFAPAIGAPLIVAGTAINTGTSGTADVVSTAAQNLQTAINTAAAQQTAGNIVTASPLMTKLITNWPVILLIVGALLFLPRLFKRRRYWRTYSQTL